MSTFSITDYTIREQAIFHDEIAFEWWKLWKESNFENETYKTIWLEHNAKRNAYLELLDIADKPYTHYIVNGEILKQP